MILALSRNSTLPVLVAVMVGFRLLCCGGCLKWLSAGLWSWAYSLLIDSHSIFTQPSSSSFSLSSQTAYCIISTWLTNFQHLTFQIIHSHFSPSLGHSVLNPRLSLLPLDILISFYTNLQSWTKNSTLVPMFQIRRSITQRERVPENPFTCLENQSWKKKKKHRMVK